MILSRVVFPQPDEEGSEELVARYGAQETETPSSIHGADSEATLEVGRLRLRFALETDERAGLICLGLARIVEMRATAEKPIP